ncbi:MAG: c-type cytochrome domain-containing protein, partial [Pirellulaceae bacterium]
MRYLILLPLFLVATVAAAEEKKPVKITFDEHVKPIFQQKCASCHNPDKKSADLDLTNYGNLMQGGASGAVIEPGDASASYLYNLVTHDDEPSMPPESPKIADEMIETLRKWIDGGVLENSGSEAKASKKKKFDMGLAAPSTERPAEVPMPAKLSLQPVIFTPTRTATDALATSPWAPLAAVSSQKQVLLYNTQTLELLGVLPFPEGTPRVLKFSRNGGLLLCGGGVAGASGRVIVWNIRTGERIIEVGDELDEVLAADISSDQTLIALGGPQRVVRIYATETGQLLHEIRKHTDWITTLEFSPDSVLLASGDRNGGLQ